MPPSSNVLYDAWSRVRRTKTQASFSTEAAAVTLLFGLVAFGQIQLRKIEGHRHLSALLAPAVDDAA